MSSFDTRLALILTVKDEGIGKLTKGEKALKELLQAHLALDKTRKNSSDQLKNLIAQEQRFARQIDAGKALSARRELELTRVQQRRAQLERDIQQKRTVELRQRAELAARTNDWATAERALRLALRQTGLATADRLRIQSRLVSLQKQQARHQSDLRNSAISAALAEARLARASGNTADEIRILNAELKKGGLLADDRRRLLTQLRHAEARARREADRHAKSLADLRRQQNLMLASIRLVRRAFQELTRILAAGVLIGFTLRTVFRAFGSAVVRPLKAMVENTIEANNQFRQLEASLIGVVGSMRAVSSLSADVTRSIGGLPLTKLEALGAVRGLAFIPATARAVSTPGPQRSEQLNDLFRILQGLATIDPDQGIEGARFAVREALAGEFRSLRFRFELSPQVIAGGIGRDLSELKADPRLTIQALQTFVDQFVGDEAFNAFNNLLTTQGKLLRGSLEEFFNLIAEAGFIDSLIDRIRNIQTVVTTAVRGGDLNQAAALISNSLTFLMESLFVIASQVTRALTGLDIDFRVFDSGQVNKLSLAFATIIRDLSLFAVQIASLADNIGSLTGTLLNALGITAAPGSLAEARAQLADVEAQRPRGRTVFTVSTGGRGGLATPTLEAPSPEAIELFQVQLARAQQAVTIWEDWAQTVGEATTTSAAIASEVSKSLQQATNAFQTALGQSGSFEPIVSMTDTITKFADVVRDQMDPSDPGSFAGAIVRAESEINALLTGRAADLIAGSVSLTQMIGQRRTTIAGGRGIQIEGAQTLLQGAPAILDNLPTSRQGAEARALFEMINSGSLGVTQQEFLRPDHLREVSQLIEIIGTDIINSTDDVQAANKEVSRLARVWDDIATSTMLTQSDLAPSDREIDRWNLFAGFLDDVAAKFQDMADQDLAKQLAAEQDALDKLTRARQELLNEQIRKFQSDLRANTKALKDAANDLRREQQKFFEQGMRGFEGVPSAGRGQTATTATSAFFDTFDLFTEPGTGLVSGMRRAFQSQLDSLHTQMRKAESDLRGIEADTGLDDSQRRRLTDSMRERMRGLDGMIESIVNDRADMLDEVSMEISGRARGLIGGADALTSGLVPETGMLRMEDLIQDVLVGLPGINKQLAGSGLDAITFGPGDQKLFISFLDSYKDKMEAAGLTTEEADQRLSILKTGFVSLLDASDDGTRSMAIAIDDAKEAILAFEDPMRRAFRAMQDMAKETAQAISDSFRTALGDSLQAILKGQANSLEDIWMRMVDNIQRMLIDLLLQAFIFQQGLRLNSVFGGIFSPGGATGSAFGNVFSGGQTTFFQSGGVVDQPMRFAMGGGRSATVAETGPEAIIPLERGLDGRLGVSMTGSGGGTSITNVKMTVVTPGADEFRRSRRQVMASMKKATDRVAERS